LRSWREIISRCRFSKSALASSSVIYILQAYISKIRF
jgi:hypothetical protein